MTEKENKNEIVPNKESHPAVLDESYFKENLNVGMEEVTTDDIPTPTLSLIQSNSEVMEANNLGKWFYKGNEKTYDTVECYLLAMTKKEMPKYSEKTVNEMVHIYLGVFADNLEPFMLFLRNYGLGASRQFQGIRMGYKKPAYCIKVKLYSEAVKNDKGSFFIPKIDFVAIEENQEKIILLEDVAKNYQVGFKEKADSIGAAKDLPF